jgi:hypothetical protein
MLVAILMRQHPFLTVVSGTFLFFTGLILYIFTGLYIFSFPLLFIGAILLLLTNNNWIFKFVVVGIPLIYVAVTFYNSFTTPATYLIPEGYRGNVMVVFNQKDGRDEEYQGRRRLYRIPLTGVLFTKFKDEEGFINEEYYYVNPSGHRTKLGVLDTRDFNEEWTLEKNPHEPPRDSLAVFNPRTIGTLGNSSDTNHKVFIELSVGTYNDMGPNYRELSPEYIDSLKRATKKNGY